MKSTNGKLRAFSLAEALVTLLIVTIIAGVSIPLISKKRSTTNDNIHGKWTCHRSGYSHVATTTIEGQTTTKTTSGSCTFTPPTKGKNFVVKVVGGGGGGAAGSQPITESFYSSTTYRIPDNLQYIVAVVGGGGAGGGVGSSPCGSTTTEVTQGGGSGGYRLETVNLKKGTSCTIRVGSGGRSSNAPGGDSSFSCAGYNFTATGGHAGKAKVKWKKSSTSHSDKYYCDWDSDRGTNDGAGGSPGGVWGSQGNYYCTSCAGTLSHPQLLRYIKGSNSLYSYGNGARPVSFSGQNGIVTLTRTDVGAGGAGDPGAAVVKSFVKLNKTKVVIGEGGAAGTSNDRPGSAGGATTFGDLITAIGGNGGETRFFLAKESTAKGQNALTPEVTTSDSVTRSYGGFTANNQTNVNAIPVYSDDGIKGAGSGGGGGGASMDDWGRGAQGMPGVVIIEW